MKKLILIFSFIFMLIGCGGGGSSNESIEKAFKLKIDTSKDTGTSFTIQKRQPYTYDYNIECGDGSPKVEGITGDYTCTYANDGIYTITITGKYPAIKFDKPKMVIDVVQWGTQVWESFRSAFEGCKNLVQFSATDTPNLSKVKSMRDTFIYCYNFNANINNWDVSNVENMSGMFASCHKFNQPLDKWDVSNVVNMDAMFSSNFAFNQNINNWVVDNVTDMGYMFYAAHNFDKPLNKWHVNKVKWMHRMFNMAYKFNQDISGWNVGNVTNMDNMFEEAKAFSNHDLSSWDVSNVKTHKDFCKNWGSNNTPPGRWSCP